MTLEQLASPEVYEGDMEADLEQNTYTCTGVLRVILQPSAKTLRMLNVGEFTLDVANINTRLTIEDEVDAWNKDQASDFWWEQMGNEESRVQKELDENGIDAQVERISDETWVRLNN